MKRIDLKKVQAAGSGTIRNINRQIVLNYVRDREPISRAEIARAAALQRSTVSAIVDELLTDGVVEEYGSGVSSGGRRPTLLRLRPSSTHALGIDLTPTSMTLAVGDVTGRLIEQRSYPVSRKFEQTMEQMIAAAKEMCRRHENLNSVGVSIPGLVDGAHNRILLVPYFQWREIPLAERLREATGLRVYLDNDVNAAALAELWFGRPEISNIRNFIMVLTAEGVGTGIVFDGQIYRGGDGAAGEFGHMIIGKKAPVACSCGNYDCWEAFASERAALARYFHAAPSAPRTTTFTELIDRALGDEEAARQALLETAHYLGLGISNLIAGFSPEVVVISGKITRAWRLIFSKLHETIDRSIRRGLPSPQILPSTLGASPTLMGALSLTLVNKFASHVQ